MAAAYEPSVNVALTPARELRGLMACIDASPGRWAQWLGVTPTSVSRYRAQADADDGMSATGPRMVPSSTVLRLARAVLALYRACPGMLGELSSPRPRFQRQLAALRGREVLLPGELSRAERRLGGRVLDGADDDEGGKG